MRRKATEAASSRAVSHRHRPVLAHRRADGRGCSLGLLLEDLQLEGFAHGDGDLHAPEATRAPARPEADDVPSGDADPPHRAPRRRSSPRCSTTSTARCSPTSRPGWTPRTCRRGPRWPSWSGARGPTVPLATWTPGEIGIQHAAGQQVVRTLAERGVPVPEEWYVVSDHPKRGLVLRTYQTPPAEVLDVAGAGGDGAVPAADRRSVGGRGAHPLSAERAAALRADPLGGGGDGPPVVGLARRRAHDAVHQHEVLGDLVAGQVLPCSARPAPRARGPPALMPARPR